MSCIRSLKRTGSELADDGKVVTGGGPTVKNVTGFDLPRLMVGALGTLGLLAELIIRTNPIPAAMRWYSSEDVDPFVILDTVLRPSAVLWNGQSTWVQLEGHDNAVQAEYQRLMSIGNFFEVQGPGKFPDHRWSLQPSQLRDTDQFGDGPWLASIGVGTVWASTPQPDRSLDAATVALSRQVKEQFDPKGRLNPGRNPGG